MRYALIAIAALVALVWGSWLIVLPADTIEERLESTLGRDGITVDAKGLRKGLFYSIGIEALEVKIDGRVAAAFYDVTLKPDWPALLRFAPGVKVSGEFGGGRISGTASTAGTAGEGGALELKARGVQLAQLDIFSLTDTRLEGTLRADVKISGLSGLAGSSGSSGLAGEGTLLVEALRASHVEIMGFELPKEIFHTARGALQLRGDTLEITSFALEGEGIYARLRGEVSLKGADVTLELMPETLELNTLLSAVAGRYKKGDNLYVIPLKQGATGTFFN